MIERFTDPSRDVVTEAQNEAVELGHNYLGTEHLLLGMFSLDENDPAQEALGSVGITYDMVRDEVVHLIGEGGEIAIPPLPFTPFTKRSLELALRQMLQLRGTYIEPAHILLGILEARRRGEVEPVATKALLDLDVDLGKLHQAVITALLEQNAASA
jgi:ATP-dependent Clp protease ATP-binding subunit ClpC